MVDNIFIQPLEPMKYHFLSIVYPVIVFFKTLFIILFFISSSSFVNANDYRILTSNLPPWSIDGKTGIFPDLINEIEKRLRKNHQPQNLPWSRAQLHAKTNNNCIIFPMTRIPRREKVYKWIVKVMPTQLVFVTFGKPPLNLEKARSLKRVIVHQDSPPYHFLVKKGFKNLETSSYGVGSIPEMLVRGRGDAWFTALAIAKYAIHGTSLEDQLIYGPPMYESWQYIAGSLNLSEEIINDYRIAFKAIKEDGVYDRIIEKYLGK